MKIKEINEVLHKFLRESESYQNVKGYIIYDDEWQDDDILDEQGVINFTIEHFWDRADDDFQSIEDFKQCIGREDGTDNERKADGTYNLCIYKITNESKKLFNIAQKIKKEQEISFEEAKLILKEMDFKIKTVKFKKPIING